MTAIWSSKPSSRTSRRSSSRIQHSSGWFRPTRSCSVHLPFALPSLQRDQPARTICRLLLQPVPLMETVEVIRALDQRRDVSHGRQVRRLVGKGRHRRQAGFIVNRTGSICSCHSRTKTGSARWRTSTRATLGAAPIRPFAFDFIGLDAYPSEHHVEFRGAGIRRRRCSNGWCWQDDWTSRSRLL